MLRLFRDLIERRFCEPVERRLLCLAATMAISSFTSFALSGVTASAAEVNRQFTLAAGGSVCFTYPEAGSNAPLHIMVSESLGNGVMLVPTSLVSAVINRDRASGQFTWIGTNGDGTTNASSSVNGHLIATGGHSAFSLMTCTIASKSNQLELSAGAGFYATYYVTMVY